MAFEKKDLDIIQETVLTRLLYEKSEVYISLFFAIIDKSFDESMFWSYELISSGFLNELIQFYFTVYFDFFWMYNYSFEQNLHNKNDEIIDILKNKEFSEKERKDKIVIIIANIVLNFVSRPYSIIPWLKLQYATDIEFESIDFTKYYKNDVPFYFELDNCDVSLYNTHKYSIRKRECYFMKFAFDNNERLYKNWMQYIGMTPFWIKRIRKYGGYIGKEGSVVFEKETQLQQFIDAYYPGFDEMTTSMKMVYGIVDPVIEELYLKSPMTWQDFYKKYYLDITEEFRMSDVSICFDKLSFAGNYT